MSLETSALFQRCPACRFDNLVVSRFCGQCGQELGRICVRCGTVNLSSASLCAACGTELLRPCPQCHTLNLPQRRFCGTCAHPLEEAADPTLSPVGRRERRKATVLFATFSGFATFSSHLELEERYTLVEQVLRRLALDVERFGGMVNRFTGDSLMAIFGVPTPLEQHALHAVWAALAIQETVRTFNQEARAKYGAEIKLRIGINAGEVVAGEVGTGHFRAYTVIGNPVDLAARLEHIAQPDCILVGEAVYRATKAYLEYRELPEIRLEGYPQPVRAYEVHRVRAVPGQSRGLRSLGRTARLVGRDEEMALLNTLAEALQQGQRRVAFITGEAGIGKSRLLEEYTKALTFKHTLLSTGCYEHTQHTPYGLFADLLKRYFALPFGQAPATTRRQIETKLRQLVPHQAETLLPFVLHLLATETTGLIRGLSPREIKQRVFEAVKAILLAEAQERPLVLLVEDLHWADDLSVELLQNLIAALNNAPVLFCCTSRFVQEEHHAWPAILERAAPDAHTIIVLDPLQPGEIEELLDLLLQKPDIPPRLRRDIVEYSEGIPLYLEELLRALIETGILVEEDGHWKATTDQPLHEIEIPRTVEEIIAARYARLDQFSREVLSTAAVIGRHIPFELLEASLSTSEATGPLIARVEALVAARFLRRRPNVSTLEYAFEHRVAREVIYRSLLHADRQALHLRVARAIEQMASPESDDYVELLAYHYLHSGRAAQAFPYLIRAGQKAAAHYAHNDAITFFQQARTVAKHISPDPHQLVLIESGLGDVLSFMGRYEEARDAYQRAIQLSQRHDSPQVLQASLWRRIGNTWERQGRYEEALKAIHNAYDLLRAVSEPPPAELAQVCSDLGWILFRTGRLNEAHQWLLQALELAREGEEQAITATVLNRLGGLAFQRGDMRTAIQYTQGALAIRESLGQRDEFARTSMNLAILYSVLGEWKRALKFYHQAVEAQRQIGEHEGLTLALTNIGMLYTLLGEYQKAHAALKQAVQLADRLDSAFLKVRAGQVLAQFHIAREEWKQADRVLTTLAAENAASLPPTVQLLTLTLLGEVAVRQGDVERAASIAEQVRSLEQAEGERLDPQTRAFVRRFYGLLAGAQGNLEEAYMFLHRSYEIETESFERARTLVELAVVETRLGNVDLADIHFAEALDIARELGAKGEVQRIMRLKRKLGLFSPPS